MFDTLSHSPRHGPLAGGLASLVVHAALITGVVLATLQTKVAPVPGHLVVRLVYVDRPPASPPQPPWTAIAGVQPPNGDEARLVLPATVPLLIPPPATAPFDPASFTAIPAPVRAVDGTPSGAPPGGVYAERWVEERPELISHPAAAFPEILRQAGIGGRVVVEAVVDTTGRVDPRSIAVIVATDPLFAEPARVMVAGSRYRPGKVGGRAVPVRVRVPVVFRVEAGPGRM